MKFALKSTLAALTFALLATFALSGCESSGGGSGSSTHNMDSNKRGSTMPNSSMPNR